VLNEIIKMREKGISFRKIAKELGTTVGKVQYQWVKYQKVLESGNLQFAAVESITEKRKTDFRVGKVKKRAALNSGKKPIIEDFTITYSTGSRIYCYWTISNDWLNHLRDRFDIQGDSPFVLRLYDITSIIFKGHNHHSFADSFVPSSESDWFINGLKDNRSYCMDIGLRAPAGEFIATKRSNVIHTPRTAREAEHHSLRELKDFEQGRVKEPKWVEHVSTYSYYVMEQEDKS
jgi:uncharacterized protein